MYQKPKLWCLQFQEYTQGIHWLKEPFDSKFWDFEVWLLSWQLQCLHDLHFMKTLRQWGAGNLYLLVLSSWKVNIAKKPNCRNGVVDTFQQGPFHQTFPNYWGWHQLKDLIFISWEKHCFKNEWILINQQK